MSDAGKYLKKLRYHVFVCADAGDFCGCEAQGSGELLGALRAGLVRRRLAAYAKVTVMNCNQPGAKGPVVVVNPDGIWYDGLTLDRVDEFIERQLIDGEPLDDLLMAGPPRTGAYAR